jgi:hypothetical protein
LLLLASQPKVLDVLAAMLDNPPILTPGRATADDGVRHISVQLIGNMSPAQQASAKSAMGAFVAAICVP